MASESLPPIEKTEVLLVDDRPENLLALETVLASPEYLLVRACSGDEALRYLLDHEPALILLDVQMPDLDGYETAAIIKRSERTRSIPIIFITALNQDDRYVLKGYQHGAIDYLYKPYDPNILKSKVAVFAELSRKTKSLLKVERQLRDADRKDRERQIAQLELRSLKREQLEQKKYLELVTGISHGIVWSVDADSMVVNFVSPSSKAILGYSEEDWAKEKDFLVNHIAPGDRHVIKEAMDQIKQHPGIALKIEHRFISTLGQELWFQTEMKLSPKIEGTGSEIRGLSVDITQIKNAQAVLSQSKSRSDFTSEASLILGQSFDFHSNLEKVGKKVVAGFANYFAIYENKEGEPLKLITEATSSQRKGNVSVEMLVELGLNEVFETGQMKHWEVVPAQMQIAKEFKAKSSLLIPISAENKPQYVMVWISAKFDRIYTKLDVAMAADLGRRTSIAIENAFLTQKAEAAVKVRDEFLSVASHELKTPLTPLKLQAQLLTRVLKSASGGELKLEKVDKILTTFDRQLDRLSLLIDELLDISKMTNGKLSMNFEEFDLNELIRDILARFSGQFSSSKCEVSFHGSGEIKVEWDRFRIEQVLINLLTNACKYGQGKPVEVFASQNANEVVVSFKDRGIGIAKPDLKRIFDRFERAVSGKHFSGLGLGLYIVSQLLEAHQGKIEVESEVGLGSTFTIRIPVKAQPIIPNLLYKPNPECLDGPQRNGTI